MSAAPVCKANIVSNKWLLKFSSLFQPGRAVVIPCDRSGRVDMDSLSDRLRTAYLGARALIGRDYAYPFVETQY